MTDKPITDSDKLAELEREIVLRRRNYPRWHADQPVELAAGERRIEVMEAIARDYRLRLQPRLDLGNQNES